MPQKNDFLTIVILNLSQSDLTYSIYVNENRCPHYFSLILYEHHLISSISLRFSRSLIWTACQYLLELSFMNQRMDAVKCTRCCTLNYKFHLHSSARIVYLRTQARGKRKYILCFEGGLSHSGLTQPQNKGQFPSKGLAGHPPLPPGPPPLSKSCK